MKQIAILGSTGSIGTQTLEVVRENGDIQVLAMAAGNNIALLEQQIREFHPACGSVVRRKGKRIKRPDQRHEDRSDVWHGWTDRCISL